MSRPVPDDARRRTRDEILVRLLDEVRSAPTAELPAIIGQVEAIKAEAFARLVAPAPSVEVRDSEDDDLLTVQEVVSMLGAGTTEKWVRRHADELGVVRWPGRQLRFSRRKLQRMIRQRREG